MTETFGPVDILVNNTGMNPVYGPLSGLDAAAARKIVEVNCLAALSWTNHVVATGLRERGGAIVNVSSTAALKPAANIPGFYGASKAMLSHLTQQLAVELAPTIRVNAVAPAVVKTKFAAALYEAANPTSPASTHCDGWEACRHRSPRRIPGITACLLDHRANHRYRRWAHPHRRSLRLAADPTGGARTS